MVDKELLSKAEEKLSFAEYLTRPSSTGDAYNAGALKHAIEAGKLAVRALIDVKSPDSPRAIQLALLRFDEPEPKLFARNFIKNWQALGDENMVGRPTVRGIIRDVNLFIKWIKEQRM